MSIIKVFEGPLCCSTGVCGPAPEQALIDFTADARWLAAQGGQLVRASLTQEPAAFAADATAVSFLRVAGVDALPLVLVDGLTVLTGRYPSRTELARYAGLSVPDGAEVLNEDGAASWCSDQATASSCCSPTPQVLQLSPAQASCCGGA